MLEEHFTEDDLLELTEAVSYAAPLLRSLKKSGVTLDIEELQIHSTYE